MKKFRTATIIILTTAVPILTAAVLLLISLEVIDAAVPPTCTETGLTEGRHSFLGGKVTKKQQPVEATERLKAGIGRQIRTRSSVVRTAI